MNTTSATVAGTLRRAVRYGEEFAGFLWGVCVGFDLPYDIAIAP